MLTEDPKLASFCLTEPDAGSDVSGMKTRAVKKGDKYVINGSKCFITNGTYADWFTVYAKTDPEAGHRGISAFVVDADLPGVTVDKKEDKMGQRASNTATISFDDVEIPAENLIGEENKGFKLAMMTLDRTRPGVAAMAVGIARAAFEFACEYSKERVQFGVPIAMHQAIQFMIADMATKVDAGRLLTWNSAVQLDQGQRNTLVSSEAKRFAADSAMEVTTDAVQVYGGYGFIKEYPVEKLMRDAKIMQLYEGTSQIQRLVIAKEVLLPRNIDERTPEAEAKQADAARDSQAEQAAAPSERMLTAVPSAPPQGKAARSGARRSLPRRAAEPAPDDRADPVAILERQARLPRPRAGADPLRADGGLAVHLLPRRRGGDGGGPGADPGLGAAGPGLRRRAPVQLRLFAAPDRRLVFDLNDFDETLPGAVGVGRQAARRELRDRRPRQRLRAQATPSRGAGRGRAHYREAMRGFAGMRNLEVWYARLDVDDDAATPAGRERTEPAASGSRRASAKARVEGQPAGARPAHRGGRRRAADRRRPAARGPGRGACSRRRRPERLRGADRQSSTPTVDPAGRPPGAARSLPVPPHRAQGGRRRQRRHPRLVILLTGRDDGDPLFLQAKEAQASVLEPYVGASRFDNHGQRVVEGQRLMQAASDIFLGWCPATRHRRPSSATSTCASSGTGRARPTSKRSRPRGLAIYARICGWTLARAHARSGDRDRDRRLPRRRRQLRPRDRRVRRRLRRPERKATTKPSWPRSPPAVGNACTSGRAAVARRAAARRRRAWRP